MTNQVSNHKAEYNKIIVLIENYLNAFDAPDVKVRFDTLTRRWEQLKVELDKKQQIYEHGSEKLKSFNDSAIQYEEWLRSKKYEFISLPLLVLSEKYLNQQKVYAEVNSMYISVISCY